MATHEGQIAGRLRENVAAVRDCLAAAAARAGRTGPPLLVGVTKYVEPALARQLWEAGVTDLAESRPQELWRKIEALEGAAVAWHLIGRLQRNKVRRTVQSGARPPCIQSADSERLLVEISRAAVETQRVVEVLLEVHVSADAAKQGFLPAEIEPLLPALAALPGVRVLGLMTMASLEGGAAAARRDFAALRELRDRLAANCPPGVSLRQLSMGMSGDYEIAVEEGATIVRIGSALFEGLI